MAPKRTEAVEMVAPERQQNVPDSFEVPLSDNFFSYINDIDNGQISSEAELEARFAATDEQSVFGDGVFINGQAVRNGFDEPVRESRRVSEEEQVLLREELAQRKKLQADAQNDKDFISLLRDVQGGDIASRKELTGRLKANDPDRGGFVSVDGNLLTDRGSGELLRETRRLDEDQQGAVVDYYDAIIDRKQSQAVVRASFEVSRDIARGQITTMSQLKEAIAAQPEGSLLEDCLETQLGLNIRLDSIAQTAEAFQTAARALVANRPVDDDRLELLNDEQRAVLNSIPGLAERLPTNLRNELQRTISGQDTDLLAQFGREKKAARSNGELAILEEVEPTILRIAEMGRQATFTARVVAELRGATDTRPLATTAQRIADYDGGGRGDQSFTKELLQLTNDCFISLQLQQALSMANGRDIAGAINFIFDCRRPEGTNAYLGILKELYTIELCNKQIEVFALLASPQTTLQQVDELLKTFPVRRQAGDFDEVAIASGASDQLRSIATRTIMQRQITNIVTRFPRLSAKELLDLVTELNGFEDEKLKSAGAVVLGRYKTYISSRRRNRRSDYDMLFSDELKELEGRLTPSYEFDQGLGNNEAAVEYLKERFKTVLGPLLDTLRGDPRSAQLFDTFFESDREGRQPYVINVEALEQERPLSDIERSYLTSVEGLSQFNPYLVALAKINPGLTQVYLDNYFETMSARTFDNIVDGDYVPLVQIGLGVHGIISAGTIVHDYPAIAEQMLFIGDVGGPFAVPNGPAWRLNSANSSSDDGIALPPLNSELESQTVRAYASPLRWYPGERTGDLDVREGSINMVVDWLPTPDAISPGNRYADNEDLALLLKLQAAMTVKTLLTGTEVVAVESTSDDQPGSKLITLERTNSSGEIIRKQIRTDANIVATGLGTPNFGFPIEGKRAEAVLKESQRLEAAGEFPILTTTLSAFRALANRETARRKNIGRTLAFVGAGNSTDTLVEFFSRLFESDNEAVLGIEKIYIVSEKRLSERGRYAGNKDVISRPGRESLVELVSARITDIDFRGDADENEPRRLALVNGRSFVRDMDGDIIEADAVVSAAGFRSQLGKIFEAITGTDDTRERNVLQQVVLPTNPGVAIANTLTADPSVLVVGTASETGFKNNGVAKFAQLPEKARDALLRNGAQNAVAIGFRGPDTQAAVRLFLEKQFSGEQGIQPPQPSQQRRVGQALTDLASRTVSVKTKKIEKFIVTLPDELEPVGIRSDVTDTTGVASAVALFNLEDVLFESTKRAYSGDLIVTITPTAENAFAITAPSGLSKPLTQLLNNRYFTSYVSQAIGSRRGGSAAQLNLRVEDGLLDTEASYVEVV